MVLIAAPRQQQRMSNPDLVPVPSEGYRIEELDGETLLYFHERKTLVYLNESAASVWKLCDGHRSTADIVVLLSKAYPEARDAMGDDVREAIESLVREGALRLAAP
jgi:hypothetical protein